MALVSIPYLACAIHTANKKEFENQAFLSVNSTWYTIADVKITPTDDLENSTKEIQALLDAD